MYTNKVLKVDKKMYMLALSTWTYVLAAQKDSMTGHGLPGEI